MKLIRRIEKRLLSMLHKRQQSSKQEIILVFTLFTCNSNYKYNFNMVSKSIITL